MKKVLIIGASSGIGRQLAELYSEAGYRVGATGRRINLLEDFKKSHKNVVIRAFDVLADDCIDNIQAIIEEMGGIDMAIISAGAGKINPELDWEIENKTVQTNVIAFTRMTDFIYKFFWNQGHGHLAAISSVASIRGLDISPSYSASKRYISIYLEALRRKSRVVGLRKKLFVTTIIPGFIKTDFIGKDTPVFWLYSLEKAAIQIFNGLEKKKRIIIVPKKWRILLFINHLIPSYIFENFG